MLILLIGDTIDGKKSDSEESFSNNSHIQKLREKVNREEVNVQKAKRFLQNQRLEIGDSIGEREKVISFDRSLLTKIWTIIDDIIH